MLGKTLEPDCLLARTCDYDTTSLGRGGMGIELAELPISAIIYTPHILW